MKLLLILVPDSVAIPRVVFCIKYRDRIVGDRRVAISRASSVLSNQVGDD